MAAYRNFLLDLPEKFRFLDGYCDEGVGFAFEPSQTARVLQQAISFFEMALEAESALAEQPAEMSFLPCGALEGPGLQRVSLPRPKPATAANQVM